MPTSTTLCLCRGLPHAARAVVNACSSKVGHSNVGLLFRACPEYPGADRHWRDVIYLEQVRRISEPVPATSLSGGRLLLITLEACRLQEVPMLVFGREDAVEVVHPQRPGCPFYYLTKLSMYCLGNSSPLLSFPLALAVARACHGEPHPASALPGKSNARLTLFVTGAGVTVDTLIRLQRSGATWVALCRLHAHARGMCDTSCPADTPPPPACNAATLPGAYLTRAHTRLMRGPLREALGAARLLQQYSRSHHVTDFTRKLLEAMLIDLDPSKHTAFINSLAGAAPALQVLGAPEGSAPALSMSGVWRPACLLKPLSVDCICRHWPRAARGRCTTHHTAFMPAASP